MTAAEAKARYDDLRCEAYYKRYTRKQDRAIVAAWVEWRRLAYREYLDSIPSVITNGGGGNDHD